jgi:hypothetical protein
MKREPKSLDNIGTLTASVIKRLIVAQDLVDRKKEEITRLEIQRLETENKKLKTTLQTKEKELATLKSPQKLEQKILQLQSELATIKSNPTYFERPKLPNIPINTDGKDAMYWHQMCRTLQAQCIELSKELEKKTNQLAKYSS